ncbi:MAG: DUF6783 domain-containing protein [Blautia faecis]
MIKRSYCSLDRYVSCLFLYGADCGIFCSNSTYAARCGVLIRAKSPTNCDVHLAEAFFRHAFVS